MRLCVISHSAVHARQQAFYRTLAEQEGVEVLALCPQVWGPHRVESPVESGRYRLVPLGVLNPNDMERFLLPGLKVVERFAPDWIYVQNEPWHAITLQAFEWSQRLKIKFALFSWENNRHALPPACRAALRAADLVVTGSTETRMLLHDFTEGRRLTDLQVGVEPEWFPFKAYDDMRERPFHGLFVSRLDDPMKGGQILPALQQHLGHDHPLCVPHRGGRLSYQAMQNYYHLACLTLTPSVEIPWRPREQGPAYTNLESLFCGTPIVTTDTASIDEWLPSTVATKVPLERLQDPDDPATLDPTALTGPIHGLLGAPIDGLARRCRESYHWAREHFSNRAVALRLLASLEAAA